jgi:hypothetical protein
MSPEFRVTCTASPPMDGIFQISSRPLRVELK